MRAPSWIIASGSSESSIPSARATVRPSATSCPESSRVGGWSHISPWVRPVSAHSGLVAALNKIFRRSSLAPLYNSSGLSHGG